jgi:hypothetical protein
MIEFSPSHALKEEVREECGHTQHEKSHFRRSLKNFAIGIAKALLDEKKELTMHDVDEQKRLFREIESSPKLKLLEEKMHGLSRHAALKEEGIINTIETTLRSPILKKHPHAVLDALSILFGYLEIKHDHNESLFCAQCDMANHALSMLQHYISETKEELAGELVRQGKFNKFHHVMSVLHQHLSALGMKISQGLVDEISFEKVITEFLEIEKAFSELKSLVSTISLWKDDHITSPLKEIETLVLSRFFLA